MENNELNEAKGLFSTIDKAMFEQANALRKLPFVENINDTIRSLSEDQQTLINQLLNALIFVLPLFVIVIMSVVVSFNKSDLEIQKTIYSTAKEIQQNHKTLKKTMSRFTTSRAINEKRDFVDQLKKNFESKSIPFKKFKIDNFEEFSDGGNIKTINVNIAFTKISHKSFSEFLLDVQRKFKATVNNLKVTKDNETRRLSGSAKLTILSKVY